MKQLSFALCFLIFFQHPSVAQANQQFLFYKDFSEKHNLFLNHFATTHQAGRFILKVAYLPKKAQDLAHYFLSQKNQVIPKMKIKKNQLHFVFKGRLIIAEHHKKSIYKINGKLVDFRSIDFKSFKKSAFWFEDLFINEVKAIPQAPIYFGMILLTTFLATVCASGRVSNASIFSSDRSFNSRSVRVSIWLDRKMNEFINAGIQACSSASSQVNYKYSKFFQDYCQGVGQRAIDSYAQTSPRAWQSNGTINPQVFRFAAQRTHELSTTQQVQSYLAQAQIHRCEDMECQNLINPARPYGDLSPFIQERINETFNDPQFIRSCTQWGLQLVTGLSGPSGEPVYDQEDTSVSQ